MTTQRPYVRFSKLQLLHRCRGHVSLSLRSQLFLSLKCFVVRTDGSKLQTEEQRHTFWKESRMFVHKIPWYIPLGGVPTYIHTGIDRTPLEYCITKNSRMSLFGDENGSIFRHCAIARI